jgi:hypothetical protein
VHEAFSVDLQLFNPNHDTFLVSCAFVTSARKML